MGKEKEKSDAEREEELLDIEPSDAHPIEHQFEDDEDDEEIDSEEEEDAEDEDDDSEEDDSDDDSEDDDDEEDEDDEDSEDEDDEDDEDEDEDDDEDLGRVDKLELQMENLIATVNKALKGDDDDGDALDDDDDSSGQNVGKGKKDKFVLKPIDFFEGMDDDQYNDTINDPKAMNNLLNNVVKNTFQGILRTIPKVVQPNIVRLLTVNNATNAFYSANPALQKHRDTVKLVATKILAEQPDLEYDKILDKAGKRVAKMLGLKSTKTVNKSKKKRAASSSKKTKSHKTPRQRQSTRRRSSAKKTTYNSKEDMRDL